MVAPYDVEKNSVFNKTYKKTSTTDWLCLFH